MPPVKLTPLSAAKRAELSAWLKEHGATLPELVRTALMQHEALCDSLSGSRYKLTQILNELRRALGITSLSERHTSGDPLAFEKRHHKSKRERLEENVARCGILASWHQSLANGHKLTAKKLRKKLMTLPIEIDFDAPDDQDPRSAAQIAADEKSSREHAARLLLGKGEEPAFESAKEAFITGAQIATNEEVISLPAPVPEDSKAKVLDTIIEERERYDFSFTVTRLALQVEKKVIEDESGERIMLSANTTAIGPPRYGVTWSFLAHMAVLVVQYAMPLNRLATLLSTDRKRFSAGSLARMLHYVAWRFAPIYLHLYDCLCDSDILTGDDTSCRVIEVSKYFKQADNSELPPWHHYRTPEAAKAFLNTAKLSQQDKLGVLLASELGFAFARRTGDGFKKALHTTSISGRSIANDPRSLIVFYRSHLGGFGNLLDTLLEKRNPKAKSLTIQSDLATVNLVANEILQQKFAINHVGCASHARRPFALYQADDPESCWVMLHLFKGLFLHEQGLNISGRNHDNVAAVRNIDSRKVWGMIKLMAEEMSTRWSRETKLGEGARYIIKNYDKLTAYLDNPRLELTNNFSERMLRLEKLIEASSLFRSTLEGRFALDIMRTVLQTAVAARAPLQDYIFNVLQTSPEEVYATPECFTPHALGAR